MNTLSKKAPTTHSQLRGAQCQSNKDNETVSEGFRKSSRERKKSYKASKYQSVAYSIQNAEFMHADDSIEDYYIPSMAMNDPFRTEYCKSVNCNYVNDDDIRKDHEPLTEEEHDSYLSIITEHDLQGVDDVELQGVDVNLEYDFNSHEIYNINTISDMDDELHKKYSLKQVLRMESKKKERFLDALVTEMDKHLNTHQSMKSVKKSEMDKNADIIRSMTILNDKTNTDGKVIKTKARLVLRGDMQTKRTDDPYLLSPSVHNTTVMMVLSIIANQKMKAECWDIGNAYLNANWTERKLYVCLDSDLVTIIKEKFPDVTIHQDELGRSYFQVQRAVYGSLQAAALWYKEVSETLNNAGYKQNSYEKCLWQKKVGNEIIIFVLYVDDFLVGSSSQSMLDDLYQVLVDKYQIVSRSKGDELEFLSMKLIFNRDTDTVDISMPKHIDDITSWVTDSKDELSITKKYAVPAPISIDEFEWNRPRQSRMYIEGILIYSKGNLSTNGMVFAICNEPLINQSQGVLG